MSSLRKHLRAAKREYDSAQYQGDLAADVLRPTRNFGPWFAWASVAAAAAVVIAAISLYGPRPNDQFAKGPTETPDEQTYVEVLPAFSPTEMGSDEALVLPATDFGFSMPTITFVEDESPTGNSTTQEAIS